MGLAAGQARLLTITGRKSDCEFESMRLSHQKIALARQLADLSNEYQNSLNQTKLVYDYYGTGDTAMDLTYGILMSPSTLNNYKPTLLTDAVGRVVLNSTYARVARAAGIPQEGLGTLPSEVMRNNFIIALADQGIISDYLKTSIVGDIENNIIGIPYNQAAGFGGSTDISILSQTMSLDDLCDYIRGLGETADVGNACAADTSHIKQYSICKYSSGNYKYESRSETTAVGLSAFGGATSYHMNLEDKDSYNQLASSTMSVDGHVYTIGDIISDALQGKDYILTIYGQDDHNNVSGYNGIIDNMCNLNLWEQMFSLFEGLMNDGSAAMELALLTARENTMAMLTNPSVGLNDYMVPAGDSHWDVGTGSASVSAEGGVNIDGEPLGTTFFGSSVNNEAPDGTNDFDTCAAVIASRGSDWYDSEVMNKLDTMTNYVGMCVVENNDNHGSSDNDSDMSAGCINISRMVMAYLTELYMQINGVNSGDYSVVCGSYDKNKFIDGTNMFTIFDREISSDVTSYAGFYDTLFNMICANGWTENEHIDENDYMKTLLKNGMVYISKQKDDNYYYQGNYAIDTYIKEIADETLIARAEANYNTEKAKLNAKEETIDMKMKNLDTEISSLTTEYDTVKSTIAKQIEKSFKRYNA